MEFTRRTMMAAGAVLAAPNFATLAQAEAQAPANRQTLDTRVGKLELINGFPTDETVAKVYDEMDFQRAVQGYLWALPIMAMCEWQRQSHETFGASNFDYVDYFDFKDKLGILTANATTPYAQAFPNMKDTGPLVVEIPAGPTAGGILDFWQRPLTDTGQTGPEKGKGAKFLVLGPDHPDVKPNGFIVVRSPTWNIWSGQRGVGDDIEKAQALVASMRIYPYSQRDKPPAAKPVRPGDKKWSAAQPRGIDYWIGLARMIDQEPAIERDRLMLAMLRPLGIEKGKPFKPDQRQTKILIDAAQLGEIMARANSYAKRFEGSRVWPNRRWEFSLFLENVTQEFSELHPARRARFLVLRSRRRDRRDARTHRRLRPSLSRIPKGRRRHLARRRQNLPPARSAGRTSRAVLVVQRLRQRISLPDRHRELSGPLFARRHRQKCGRLDRSLFWPETAGRRSGKELDQDASSQRLVHLLPALRPDATVLRSQNHCATRSHCLAE